MAFYLKNIRLNSVLNFYYNQIFDYKRFRILFPTNQFNNENSQYRNIHINYALYKRRKSKEENKAITSIENKKAKEVIAVWIGITLNELANILARDVKYVKELFLNEIKDPNTPIFDMAYLQNAVRRSGKRLRMIGKPTNNMEIQEEIKDLKPRPAPSKDQLTPRPPVVTVMGHVDHGKTTLLDALRHSSVVENEFGGITQHIGAFLVNLDSGAKITFLDTPGHAAFSSMRARGANLTDIVVLVVAADDGVMEQTIESVKMAKNAKVPILVAINKIDSSKANIERTEKMLLEAGTIIEKFGGDVQAIPISALKKQNLKQLIEALILQADLLEIRGDPSGPVEAVIVESNLHQYRGKLTTLVVQRGTLKKGDILVAGTAMGKVRLMKSADGQTMDKVSPGYSAEIEGWKDLPAAGDIVLQAESEKEARQVIKFRERELEGKKSVEDLKLINMKRDLHNREYQDNLKKKREMRRYRLKPEGPRKPEIEKDSEDEVSINVIVKADVDGTLEAILETLDTYESEQCPLDIVHYGVGPVTQSDIALAKTFNCVLYAFNLPTPNSLKPILMEHNVEIKDFNVIYKLIEDFKEEVNSR